MKKLSLKPSKIIVPGEYYLGNDSILKIYHRIFSVNHQRHLPPVVVTRFGDLSQIQDWLEETYKHWEQTPYLIERLNSGTIDARRSDYKTLFDRLSKHPYLLLDGNHRSTAAELNHRNISALEIECDEDIGKIREMVEKGDLFNFNLTESSLYEIRRSFVAHCLDINLGDTGKDFTFAGCPTSQLKYIKTVEERVKELVANRDLPAYMIDKYLGENKK